MAHEGFNWKQQSLLACILFSSRVQRTPIISFLLYCLFSRLPSSSALSGGVSAAGNGTIPSPPFVTRWHPRARELRSLPSSFERFVSRTYVPRTISDAEFESFAEIHPDLAPSPASSSRHVPSLSRQWNFFVQRSAHSEKERRAAVWRARDTRAERLKVSRHLFATIREKIVNFLAFART